ncbi:MAG: hypothetical protein H0X46_02400, partial [Bacteroidetes bacterium]|nr:hypothetical protein [Bacteroidota bacterium]
MKHFYLTTSFLLLSLLAFSQTIQWSRTFVYGDIMVQFKDLKADSSNNIYFSGNYAKTNYPNPILRGWFITKFDVFGNTLWTDTTNEQYVISNPMAFSDDHIFTIHESLYKFNKMTGDTVWHKSIPGQGITYLNNALYLGHLNTLYKYDSVCNLQWNITVPMYAYGEMQINNAQGNLYVRSGSGNASYNPCALHKYDTFGNRLWTTPSGMGYVWNMITDEIGNSYLIGQGGGSMVKRINSDGTVAWAITRDSLAWYNA